MKRRTLLANRTITLSRAQAQRLRDMMAGKLLSAMSGDSITRTERALYNKLFDAAEDVLGQLSALEKKG